MNLHIIFAGGGTGGHVNPALAIASYLRDKGATVTFIGGEQGIEKDLVPRAGFPFYGIEAYGLRRSFRPRDMAFNMKALQKAVESKRIVKKILLEQKPDMVFGAGGYVSYPVVSAAQSLGIKTALLEVNALPGMTTKALSKKADKIFICFEETRALLRGKNMVLTGAPVRAELLLANRKAARETLGLEENQRYVLSFWGSLGAKYMNEHMLRFMEHNTEEKAFLHLHAAGKAAFSSFAAYADPKGASHCVEYIYDMATNLAAADLVICRGGAASIGELCALGKAAVLVPSPYVAENHQEKNARALEKMGAAKVIVEARADGETLFSLAQTITNEEIKKMEAAALSMARPDALHSIYKEIMALSK